MNDSKLYSQEAEQSVLGAIMLDEIAFDIVTEVGLQASHFYGGNHKLVFEAITYLSESAQPTDVVTVAERLDVTGKLEAASGAAYLSRMVDITPSIDNAKAYAEIIIDRSRRRSLVALSGDIRAKIDEGAETEEVKDYTATQLQRMDDDCNTGDIISGDDALRLAITRIDERFNFEGDDWTFGIDQLDKMLVPEPSRVIGIIGATSSGKSTLAQTAAETSLNMGIPVFYATMEMPPAQMMNRFISSAGDVNRDFLRDPRGFANPDEQWPRLAAGTQKLKGLPLTIDGGARQTISTLTARIKAWVRKMKAEGHTERLLVVVDHVHLMSIPGKDIVNELGNISKGLKFLALETGVCILPLFQVNRGITNRPDRRPMKHDIRDSGKIEADLDAVIGVYRDEIYNPDTEYKGVAEAIISKSRDGELGTAFMKDDLRFSRFGNLNDSFQSQN